MSGVIQSPEAVVRAHCEDCDWEFDRSLEAGDGLTAEQNQEIATRVVRNHAFMCGSDDERDWGETADVRVDTAEPRGE